MQSESFFCPINLTVRYFLLLRITIFNRIVFGAGFAQTLLSRTHSILRMIWRDMSRIVAIIPARMGSTRFPGKPLASLLGRPMLEHVVHRASMCDLLDAVYVATCDEEIRDVVTGFGAAVLMTSATHQRASDRVAEAADAFEADIVVMIQGDEPMIIPKMIVSAVVPMIQDPSVACVNLARRIVSREEYADPN